MRALITGAAGFIGSHLTERLLGQGWSVVGVDSFDSFYDPAIKRNNIREVEKAATGSPEITGLTGPSLTGPPESRRRRRRLRIVEADVRDPDLGGSIARVLDPGGEGFDVVVHLAARAGVRPSVRDPQLYADVNLGGTMRVLELARTHGARRVIFASSSSVYGARLDAPFRETDETDRPISPYAATKRAGEVLCHAHAHLFDLAVTCLRFFTVYGPRQRPEMAIHRFTHSIDRGEPITVFGDGSARRDFTYITDIVDGVVNAIERAQGFRIYNLGGHRAVELTKVIERIEAAVGKQAIIERAPEQPGDVPLTCADITRASEELDYHPRVRIEAGIDKFVAWYREQSRDPTRPAAPRRV